MFRLKSFASTVMCIAALSLASCGTTGSNQTVAVASVPPVESVPPGTPVTIGTLTDPCSLGLYDPWWIDHGGNVEFHRRCG